MKVNFYWHSYRYLPYEQVLAARELGTLLGQEPIRSDEGLSLDSSNGWKSFAQRTTYFREVIADDGSRVIPLQTILESSSIKSFRQQQIHFDANVSSAYHKADILSESSEDFISQPLSKQSTRYSAHGLHEYRGKFNPQIVRAIGNLLGLQPGDWLLDPFCGSGTSLLEAFHMDWNAISVDINPLGIQIARAKIAAMRVPKEDLRTQTEALSQRLNERFKSISFDSPFSENQIQLFGGENWQNRLPSFDYLCSWFTKSVLVQLSAIIDEVDRTPSKDIQFILRVILSDIVREVSLQDPGDLRIRRRKSPLENMPAIPLYLSDVKSKIETILMARQYVSTTTTMQDALLGDSRYCAYAVRAYPKISSALQFDAAITSPPYATALPYIDTQRLSLVLLGLIRPEEIRVAEKQLTGNREITAQERLKLEEAIENNQNHLPDVCIQLCRKLKASIDEKKDGFRRKNVPALLYQYLVEMALMFRHTHPLLRDNAPFALVVGQNQTQLGGQTFVIDTPRLLVVLAENNGFVLQETIELDTYQRFDVHQGNSIRSETLIILRKVEHAN